MDSELNYKQNRISLLFILFILFIFFLPFYRQSILDFNLVSGSSVSIGLSDILLIFIIVLLILRAIFNRRVPLWKNIFPLLILVLVFISYLLLTVIWSNSVANWLYYFIRITESMLAFILPFFIVKDKRHLLMVMYAYSSSIIIFLIDTILRVKNLIPNLFSSAQNYWITYAQFKQSYFVKDTNTVGFYLILILGFLLYLNSLKSKRVFKLFIVIDVFLFLLTISREAIIAVVASSLILLPFAKYKTTKRLFKNMLLIIIIILLVLALLGVFLKNFYKESVLNFLLIRYLGVFNFTSEAGFMQRIALVKSGYKIFVEHPLFGVGLGGYLENNFVFFHNLLITLAVSTGVIGLIMFLILALFTGVTMRHGELLGEIGLWCLLTYFIQGFAMFDLTESYFWVYTGIIIAGIGIEKNYEKENKDIISDNVI